MNPAHPALLLCLVTVAIAGADADPEQVGEVTYRVPAGWEKIQQDRIVILTPRGSTPDECSVVLTSGETLAADANFNQWFKDKWAALHEGWKVVQGGQRTGQEGPRGSSVYYQAAMLEAVVDGKPTRRGLLLYAVHVGDAVHWVVFRTEGAKPFNEHKKTVNAFLSGLKIAEVEAPGARRQKKAQPKPPSERAKPPQVLQADAE